MRGWPRRAAEHGTATPRRFAQRCAASRTPFDYVRTIFAPAWRGADGLARGLRRPCICPQGLVHNAPFCEGATARSVRLKGATLQNAALCKMHGCKPRDRPGAEREAKHGQTFQPGRLWRRWGNLRSTRSDRPNSSRGICPVPDVDRSSRTARARESQMSTMPLLKPGRMTRSSSRAAGGRVRGGLGSRTMGSSGRVWAA